MPKVAKPAVTARTCCMPTGNPTTTNVGEPFNPWRKICGFYPPDIVGGNKDLKLTDGQKRLYERGVRWAGKKGVFYYGFRAIATALGKSIRQVKDDMATLEAKGLMAHTRQGPLPNLYRFLWHPIFEVQPTAHQEGDLEVQDSTLEVQDSVIKGPLKVQPTAHKSCTSMNYVSRISSSSALEAENVAQPDDDPKINSKNQNQHPDPEAFEKRVGELQRMLQLSRAESLNIPVEQIAAPDRTITVKILEVFADFADAQTWVEKDTIRRGLARKSRSSMWGLWLEDAKNSEVQIRLDREAAEEEEAESRIQAAEEAEAEQIRSTPMPAAQAIDVLVADAAEKGPKTWIPPWALKAKLERTNEYVSPDELLRLAKTWKRCTGCRDVGRVGSPIDRDLRWCSCPAAVEARYRDGDNWPELEIARVHASTKSLLIAACRELGSYFSADVVESAEVVDDGKQISIRLANPKDKILLGPRELCEPLSRVGLADRTVEVAGAEKKGPATESKERKALNFRKKGAAT